jgi:hypothetical protein
MGTVRFGLAMVVVHFHTKGELVFGVRLPDARLAGQLFYVISGFYMALILGHKYKAPATNSRRGRRRRQGKWKKAAKPTK